MEAAREPGPPETMDTHEVTHAHPLVPSFGISVTPYAEAYPQIVEQVLAAERSGFELVGIQDHPYQRRFLDTFALIADLLARTSRLRFFPDVASLPMRPPTMLAKAAASLDVMSGGRFELGIGAGNFWDAVVGMGGPRRQPGERGAALEEAIDIIRAALDVGTERGVVRGSRTVLPGARLPRGAASGTSRGDLGGGHGAARAGTHRAKGRRLGPGRRHFAHRRVCHAWPPGSTTLPLPPAAIREPSGASSTSRAASRTARLVTARSTVRWSSGSTS